MFGWRGFGLSSYRLCMHVSLIVCLDLDAPPRSLLEMNSGACISPINHAHWLPDLMIGRILSRSHIPRSVLTSVEESLLVMDMVYRSMIVE